MAAFCERENVRIRVQVVASVLPVNIPIHVDPFWILVKFSECPLILDVEAKLLSCLNAMIRDCHLELAVHGSPLTPAWTYLSSSYSGKTSVSSNHQTSDDGCPMRQYTILLKPLSCGCDTEMKPSKPVMKSFDISHFLRKPLNLKFSNQLIMMNNCLLLGSTNSEVLRDDDIITVNAVCDFCTSQSTKDLNKDSSDMMECSPAKSSHLGVKNSGDDKDKIETHNLYTMLLNEEEDDEVGCSLTKQLRSQVDYIIEKLTQSCTPNDESDNTLLSHKHSKKKLRKRRSELLDEAKESKKKQRRKTIENRNPSMIAGTVEINTSSQHKKSKSEISRTQKSCMTENGNHKKRKKVCDDKNEETTTEPEITSEQTVFEMHELGKGSKREQILNQLLPSVENDSSSNKAKGNNVQGNGNNLAQQKTKNKGESNASTDSSEEEVVKTSAGDGNLKNIRKSGAAEKDRLKKKKKGSIEDHSDTDAPAVTTDPSKMDDVIISPKRNEGQPNKTSGVNAENLSQYFQHLIAIRKEQINNKQEIDQKSVDEMFHSGKTEDQCGPHQGSTSKKRRPRRRKSKKNKCNVETPKSKQPPEKPNRDFTLKLPENLKPQNCHVTFGSESDDDTNTSNRKTTKDLTTSFQGEGNQKLMTNTNNQSEEAAKVTGHVTETVMAKSKPLSKKQSGNVNQDETGTPVDPGKKFNSLLHQCGSRGRRFETVASENGHFIYLNSRQRQTQQLKLDGSGVPYKEMLTNVSLVVEPSTPSTPKDSYSSASHVSQDRMALNSASTSPIINLETKNSNSVSTPQNPGLSFPMVEITPLFIDYTRCDKLNTLPRSGDIIAYKILELAEDYTPTVSNFKEAKVISVDDQAQSMDLELRETTEKRKRTGRFELEEDDLGDYSLARDDEDIVTVNMSDFLELRLVKQSDEMTVSR